MNRMRENRTSGSVRGVPGNSRSYREIVFFNMIVFLVTSADSASFFVAMQMSKGQYEPKTALKLTWGIFLGALALVLLISGGMNGLKTASLVAGSPFAIAVLFMMVSLVKSLKKEII